MCDYEELLNQYKQKSPDRLSSIRGCPCYPRDHMRYPLSTGAYKTTISGRFSDFRIILLAAPSHPSQTDSDMLRFLSPVTAAGPSPIFTEFPFKLLNELLN
jgi:hypothetical protein